MQKLNTYFLIPTLVAIGLSQVSCKKDFLEIEPKSYLIAKNTRDYEQILNALSFSSIFTASGYLGDEVAGQKDYFDAASLRSQRLFKYEDRVYDPNELPLEISFSTGAYQSQLYSYNKVINEVMASREGTDQQKRTILAEAKVGRAVCFLGFLNDFTKPYNAATASTDPGIPLITKADVTQTTFIRASVKESYDFMIKDIKEALPDLGPLIHRRKFSVATAEFFLARIYLYMGNFAEARTHIDAVFTGLATATAPIALYDYNVVLDPNGVGTWLPNSDFGLTSAPLSANNTQVLFNIVSSTFFFPSLNTYVFSPETALLFDPSDRRKELYSDMEAFGTFKFPKGMMRLLGFGTDIGPSLPDLYLMRAELKARANDLAGAKSDVETLRFKRMPANVAPVPTNIASDQVALVKFILEERIREFALTGLRWLDMRRLSTDATYGNTVKYKHNMYDQNGNVVETFTLKPERFAIRFGERMLTENQGLTENQ